MFFVPVQEQFAENTNKSYHVCRVIRAGPRDVVAGGALKGEVLNRAAKSARRGSMRGGSTPSY